MALDRPIRLSDGGHARRGGFPADHDVGVDLSGVESAICFAGEAFVIAHRVLGLHHAPVDRRERIACLSGMANNPAIVDGTRSASKAKWAGNGAPGEVTRR